MTPPRWWWRPVTVRIGMLRISLQRHECGRPLASANTSQCPEPGGVGGWGVARDPVRLRLRGPFFPSPLHGNLPQPLPRLRSKVAHSKSSKCA